MNFVHYGQRTPVDLLVDRATWILNYLHKETIEM